MRVIISLLFLLCGSGLINAEDLDLSFNKTFYLQNVGGKCECCNIDSLEVDSYWIDSWTVDAQGRSWYTPEKYEFTKGDTIGTVVNFILTGYDWEIKRYDSFYFCGEQNPMNYVAYGWYYFDNFYPRPFCISVINYDTDIIPDRFLPLQVDWASKCIVNTGWFAGGVPLNGRPDCFTITK